ncbi:MAG TPA: MBL fold metallo-hydrolase [Chloroflexia bacterium]|nr:MBL fold metallo-hydrolase [Chloroflexia bacterium]
MLSARPYSGPLTVAIRTPTGEVPSAAAPDWEIEINGQPWSGPGQQVQVQATWRGTAPVQAGLVVRRGLDPGPHRILIPGVFYGDNGVGGIATRYPRLGPLDHAAFTAPGWDFAAERTALPAAFAWGADVSSWLAVEPHGTGVGFQIDGNTATLAVHRPGLEAPFRHDRRDESPHLPLAEVAPGEALTLTVWYGNGPPDDPTAFAPIQRALQKAWGGARARTVSRPAARAAAGAAAEGLLRWHLRSDLGPGVLAETVAFDGSKVRDEMHVAWISGAPAAYALLRHGRTRGDGAVVEAGQAVLDRVASGLAPCGAFWGIWTPRGWRAGWNGDPQKLHARTLAEATLFLVRALALEPEHPTWAAAARSNLDYCLTVMDDSGHPGSYYHADTGAVLDRRGTAGLLWAAALAEGAAVLDVPAYRDAAVRTGAAYTDAIRSGALQGAPEDIGLCPSSEDGYNAVIATMALHAATGDAQWLELARQAADWMLTFRWSYDVAFPPGSPLARRGFLTRGADGASPSNHHLHAYGLICSAELRRLSTLLRDPWYAARAADHLACFVGEVALTDGAFGGAERRGMMAEQWYSADWAADARAGDVGAVSHAWCLGLLLLAAEEWLDAAATPTASRATPATPAGAPPHLGSVTRGRRKGPPPTADRPHAVRLLPGFYQVGGGFLSHPRDAASYLLLDEVSGASIMVDCGSHSGVAALRANVAQVADLQKVQLVIGTHGHWDHVEAFGHLREETGARIAVHALDAGAVEAGNPDLTCAGFLYNETFHAFPVDLQLQGGERFAIGDYTLEILHLPGHSPGCIGVKLLYARTGQTILIPGDAVNGAFGKRIHSSLSAWRRSMRRLMREPIDLMVPNHMPGGAQTALLADVPNRLARVYIQLETDFLSFMDAQRT